MPRSRIRRRTALVGGLVTAVAAAAAVTFAVVRDPGPRPVTGEEAQQLALARFSMYERSPAALVARAPMAGGTVEITGLVDYRRHRGVGSYRVSGGAAPGAGLVAWDATGLAVARRPSGAGGGPADPAAVAAAARAVAPGGWSSRAYTGDPFDVVLRLTVNLGADRPENAQLLAQSGAEWVGSERLEGRSYGVFGGPVRGRGAGGSRLRYWLDPAGGLRRVEARPAGLPAPLRVDVAPRPAAAAVPDAPWQARRA
ncbi:hypothetical protein [Streptomyces sp. NPDC089919]|uniref:hypothetical protein n=1 Tax=Streptomyces sp. NPDC089919 TaxID=3155188 RepID=UPI003412784F